MFRIGVDVGGTFSDLAVYDTSDDHVAEFKSLTTPDTVGCLSTCLSKAADHFDLSLRDFLAPISVGISSIFPVPEAMSDEDAAGYVIAGHTAYHAAVRRGQVAKGETVIVTGAAGGLGSAIVQLSVATGAKVFAVVGGSDKAEFVRSLGAEPVDHLAVDVPTQVRALNGGQGVNLIVDPVQGEMGGRLRAALAPDGRHVLCGHAGGLLPHDPDFYLYNHTLVGATLGSYPRPQMQRIHAETHAALTRLFDEGKYRPLVTRVVDFADVPAAVTDLAERRTMGRVVVRISGS